MPHTMRPGDVLADRYRLVDLLSESGGGRFWRAHDRVLERVVALHIIGADDERSSGLLDAARRSAVVLDHRMLRVLDAEQLGDLCYVVNEWGSGTSLDILLANDGPLPPRRAAWVVAEVADSIATAHAAGVVHGRLVPENVLIDRTGSVKVIGLAVDAALHGLPDDQVQTDVTDLAGLLFCALTCKWAGASTSQLPRAPLAHGRVLRPRQVRAGVPKPLDSLCDDVLNPYATHAPHSAGWLASSLFEFVGDPAGMPEAMAKRATVQREETVVLSAVPEIPARDPYDDASTSEDDRAGSGEPPVEPDDPQLDGDAEVVAVDEATEAGLPIFGDDADDVSWLTRQKPAPPPPPFEPPPERPLFAPEPEDGTPIRRARPGMVSTDSGILPWASAWEPDEGGPSTGTSSAHGGQPVPGRRWFRLAVGLGITGVLLIAVVLAIHLGSLGGGESPTPGSGETATTSSAAQPRLLDLVGATDLDPEGDPPSENPEDAHLAVDGDPDTGWSTQTYDQNFGPAGLKSGVGLIVDLGSEQSVTEIALSLNGPTRLSVYLTDTPPTSVDGLQPVAGDTVRSSSPLMLDEPTVGRYLTIWLTSLPPNGDGRFRCEIDEIEVRG